MKTTSLSIAVLAALLVAGCGGGGGSAAPTVVAPAHAAATLPLTAAIAPEIAAQATAVVTSMRSLGYRLASQLDSVSPANPVNSALCGTGSISYTYIDTDRDGRRSAGDQIRIAAPGCSVDVFGNGSATATLLAVSGNDLVDVRVDIDSGTLPFLAGWNWVPTMSGTLRLTADGTDLWLRSDGELVFTASPTKSFAAFNIGMRLVDDVSNNPPSPGIGGSVDIRFDTPTGAGRTVALDTVTLWAGFGSNSPPDSGHVMLRGAGASSLRLEDDRPTNPGWFALSTDANGDGVVEARTSISFVDIFGGL